MNKLDDYKQRLWQIIERECDGSRMNDTKWMEMLDVLKGLQIRRRVKWVDDPKASHWTEVMSGGFASNTPTPYIEGPSSPTIVLAVEWMEIDPISRRGLLRSNHAVEIEKRLQSINVPYIWEGLVIRITGHVRKASGIQQG